MPATGEQRYGVEVVVTSTGVAVFDQTGAKLKDLSGLLNKAGASAKEFAGATAKATTAAEKTGSSFMNTGALIKTAGNAGSAALQNMALQTGFLTKEMGALGGVASAIGFKAVEEGIESVAEKALKFGGNLKSAGLAAATLANPVGIAAAAITGMVAITAAAGVAVNRIIKTYADYRDEMALVDEATSKSNEMTPRQIEQYNAVAASVNIGKERFKELLPNLAAVLEHSKKHPEGDIAAGWKKIAEGADKAREAIHKANIIAEDTANTAKQLWHKMIPEHGFLSRLEEMQKLYRDLMPNDLEAEASAVNRAFMNIANTTGKTSVAAEVLSGRLFQLEENAKRAGKELSGAIKGEIFAARVGEIVKAQEKLFPENLMERAKQLSSAFGVVEIKTGDAKLSIKAFGEELKQLAEHLRNTGQSISNDLQKRLDQVAADERYKKFMEEMNNSQKKWEEERKKGTQQQTAAQGELTISILRAFDSDEQRYAANRQHNEKALQDSKNWATQLVADAEKVKNAYAAVRATVGLTGEDDKIVNVDRNDSRIRAGLEQLKKLEKEGGISSDKAREARQLLLAGNISALEKLAVALKEQAAVIGNSIGTNALGSMSAQTALTGLAGLIRQLAGNLGSLPGRASGGPVSAGGMYVVGESGPEILRMGSRSGEVIPAGQSRSMFGGGSAETVAELRALRADLRTFGQRQQAMTVKVVAEGGLSRELAKAVRFEFDRNQA